MRLSFEESVPENLNQGVLKKITTRLFAIFIEYLEKVYLDLGEVFTHNSFVVG